ncbi:Golgi transport complex subunit 3 [Sorochytrium milnesiophthora]
MAAPRAAAAAAAARVDWDKELTLQDAQIDVYLALQKHCSDASNVRTVTTPTSTNTGVAQSHSPPSLTRRQSPEEAVQITRQRRFSLLLQLSSDSSLPPPSAASFDGLPIGDDPVDELGKPLVIENPQQFLEWFAALEEQMEQDNDRVFEDQLLLLRKASHKFDAMADAVDQAIAQVQALKENHTSATQALKAMQGLSSKYQKEELSVREVATELERQLAYFASLESITQTLNAPGAGDSIVQRSDFPDLLQRIDECLEFLEQNPRYKESALYAMRYRQCMTKSLTLVKNYFSQALRTTITTSMQSASTVPLSTDTAALMLSPSVTHTHLYVTFRALATRLKSLISCIETRCVRHPEYNALANDCRRMYVNSRRQVIPELVNTQVGRIGKAETGKLQFMRTSAGYLQAVCADEYLLYYQFFDAGCADLDDFLHQLSSGLYDRLRPMILQEPSIELLSDICRLIASLTALSHSAHQQSASTDESGAVDHNKEAQVCFIHGIESIAQDAQQRLVFRATHYIQEMRAWKPAAGDLDYPARLQGLPPPEVPDLAAMASRRNSASVATINPSAAEAASPTQPTSQSAAAFDPPTLRHTPTSESLATVDALVRAAKVYEHWFPMLQKTFWILGKLYKCIERSIFDSLSQEIVDTCLQSLISASLEIRVQKTELDGQLFLIRHLLLLRDHLVPFDSTFLRNDKWLSVNLSLSSAKVQVMQQELDARMEVDRELKKQCEEFIVMSVNACGESLRAWMTRCLAVQNRKASVRQFEWGTESRVQTLYEEFVAHVRSKLSEIASSLAAYLQDKRTEYILLKPIKDNLQGIYQGFRAIVSEEYGDIPTLQDQCMQPEEFMQWTGELCSALQ